MIHQFIPAKRTTYKRCKYDFLAWHQTSSGKWLLCNLYLVNGEEVIRINKNGYVSPHDLHRCVEEHDIKYYPERGEYAPYCDTCGADSIVCQHCGRVVCSKTGLSSTDIDKKNTCKRCYYQRMGK